MGPDTDPRRWSLSALVFLTLYSRSVSEIVMSRFLIIAVPFGSSQSPNPLALLGLSCPVQQIVESVLQVNAVSVVSPMVSMETCELLVANLVVPTET